LNSPFNGVEEEELPPFWKQDKFYQLMMAIARYLVIAIIAWVMWRKLVHPAWIRHQETSLRRMEMEKEARQGWRPCNPLFNCLIIIYINDLYFTLRCNKGIKKVLWLKINHILNVMTSGEELNS